MYENLVLFQSRLQDVPRISSVLFNTQQYWCWCVLCANGKSNRDCKFQQPSLYFPQLLNSCSCTACHEIQVQLQLLSRLELQLQLKLHYLKMWRINQRVELQLQLRMYLKQLSCSRLVWMRLGTKREPESFKYTVGSGSVFASFLSSKSSTLQVSYPNQSTATELF